MAVTVWIPPLLRRHSAEREELTVSAGTLADVLAELGAVGREILARLASHREDTSPPVKLFLNGRLLAGAADLTAPVEDGAELAIVPVIGGGG